eukprot:s2249_g4.t1
MAPDWEPAARAYPNRAVDVRNGQVEMTAEDESETVGLLPKDEPPEGEEDSVSAPNSGPDPRKLPQLVLDAPLPPTIDDDAPGADYWLDDDAEADELEAGDEPGPLRSMSEDPDSPRCLRLGSTKSEPAHSRFSGSADLLLLRAEVAAHVCFIFGTGALCQTFEHWVTDTFQGDGRS